MLWANVQVKRPAIYARCPVPVVSRKFKDSDPVGRLASEVLERCLLSSIESYDFDWTMKQCRDELLLFARGQAWARYVPHITTIEPAANDADQGEADGQITEVGEAYEDVDYEEVICDYVAWSDFCTNVARNWNDVRWVARRVYMLRAELHTRFDEHMGVDKVKKIPLDWRPDNASDDPDKLEQFGKAQIYEVWDKVSKKVFWISKTYADQPLDERTDPLGLKDFFPCPRPLLGTVGRDSMIPIPEYLYYQDQAEEVDELTIRIGTLTDALRMVGFYAANDKDKLLNVFASGNENKLIPIDSWAAFAEKGGVKGLIEWVPIDMVVTCLEACFKTRKEVLDDIFQITGISDIMRGDTDPDETKGAQELKSQWGSSRVREDQKEVARFARDLLRIKGEIIGNKFSVETLKSMTDLELFTEAEKQQVQQQIALQQAQQQQAAAAAAQQQIPPNQPGVPPAPAAAPPQPPPQAQIPPDIQRKLDQPSWDEVMALLRNRTLSGFRIDVETDSTVEPDQTRDRAQAMLYASTMGELLAKALPFVQVAPMMMPYVGEMIKFVSRRFNAGRELEDMLDKAIDAVSNMPPQQPEKGADPAVEQGKLAIERMKVQIQAQELQMKARIAQGEQQVSMAQIGAENIRSHADVAAAQADAHADRAHDHAQAGADRAHDQTIQAAQMIHEAIQKTLDRQLTTEIADKSAETTLAAAKMKPKPASK